MSYILTHKSEEIPADFTGSVEAENGDIFLYKNGNFHTDDNNIPSFRRKNGELRWHKNGVFHRENGLPAVKYPNGRMCFFVDGKLHGNGKPAIVCHTGVEYYENGQRHREDGPAVEHHCGAKEYWLEDKYYSNKEHWKEAVLARQKSRRDSKEHPKVLLLDDQAALEQNLDNYFVEVAGKKYKLISVK